MATLSRLTTWSDNQVLNAADLNAEFNNIMNDYNGGITNANISASAAIAISKINTASASFTNPTIVTSILDTNGNQWLRVTANTTAVNDVTIANAATTFAPVISATGDDTNIDLQLVAKGTGKVLIDSVYGVVTTSTPSGGGTATLNLATSNRHFITMPAGNITIALSNASVGQVFIIRILQDSGGSRTVTWFSGITWATAAAPTLTTTASRADMFGFIVRAAGTYDGFIVGQNIG